MNMYCVVKDIASDAMRTIFEGGPGSGNWGHKGRPGKRGGSLPGGGVSAHVSGNGKRIYSRVMAARIKSKGIKDPAQALSYIKSKYPGQPEDRYQRALTRSGVKGGGGAKTTDIRSIGLKTEIQLKVQKELETGAVSNVRPLGGGVTPTYVVNVGDRKGVFKTMNNRARKEVAAYEFDKMIGFGVVPPTVYRTVDLGKGKGPEKGSVMHFVEGKLGSKHIQEGGKFKYLDMAKITAFDFIIGNQDRHPGNYVVDKNDRTWAIDNALTFWKSDKIVSSTIAMVENRPIPPEVKTAVNRLIANRKGVEKKLNAMMSSPVFTKRVLERAEELSKMTHFPKDRFEWHKPWTEKHGYTPDKVKGLAEGLGWLQKFFSTNTTSGKTATLR